MTDPVTTDPAMTDGVHRRRPCQSMSTGLFVALAVVVSAGALGGVVAVRKAQNSSELPEAPVRAATLVSVTPMAAPTVIASSGPTAAVSQPKSAQGRPVPSVEWVRDMSAKTGIPEPALKAYAAAQLQVTRGQPDCRLTWPTLAGIGQVESRHGGSALRPDGVVDPPIIGPALDGGPALAVIRDTDAGALDGDPTWDRAVGPMQFIPSSWARWGVAARPGAVPNPQDLNDAALAAAQLLCTSGLRLDTAKGWQESIHGYNHSMTYVDSVREAANAYAQRSLR